MRKLCLLTFRAYTRITMAEEHFFYFGYGSNLLKQRIQLRNPSAEVLAIGKLQDYKLDFNHSSRTWQGATATVTSSPGDHVWGVVWRMHERDRPNIDQQEGVASGTYRPIQVNVQVPSGERYDCRSYELLKLSATDRRPSPQYHDVIIRGARQNGLPPDYLAKLEAIETNGHCGELEVYNAVLKMLGEDS